MQNEPNKPELKLEMAKLLPELIEVRYYTTQEDECPDLLWKRTERDIPEESWLFVMQMVEDTVDKEEFTRCLYQVIEQENKHHEAWEHLDDITITSMQVCATFNQRATAMRKLKGIKFS